MADESEVWSILIVTNKSHHASVLLVYKFGEGDVLQSFLSKLELIIIFKYVTKLKEDVQNITNKNTNLNNIQRYYGRETLTAPGELSHKVSCNSF